MFFFFFFLTVFNQKTLYDAYKKRTKNINIDLEEYNKLKEADPEFYREASSLQYGKVSILFKFLAHVLHLLVFPDKVYRCTKQSQAFGSAPLFFNRALVSPSHSTCLNSTPTQHKLTPVEL